MDELPKNITRFEVLKIRRDIKKLCRCRGSNYVVDTQNHLVYCDKCGAVVSPWQALVDIATHYDRLQKEVENLLEERRKIANYQPRRVVIKQLEQQYCRGKGDMLPTCPRCGKPFYLSELTNWVNKKFYPVLNKERSDT